MAQGRKYKCDAMSVQSINDMISELQDYRDGAEGRLENVADYAVILPFGTTYYQRVSESPLAKTTRFRDEDPRFKDDGFTWEATMQGTPIKHEGYADFNTALAIEYGAGITYNPNPNPWASKAGLGVGTFPGQKHAFSPNGWYFKNDNGRWEHSFGVKATMPLYHAMTELRQNIVELVRKAWVMV